MPGGVKLNIEQDQAAVPKGVDGAQGERRHQSGEEGAPQGFQREVIADLARARYSRRKGTSTKANSCQESLSFYSLTNKEEMLYNFWQS